MSRKVTDGSGGGAWVAQSVKCLTLGFSSGHDLMVQEFEPCIRLFADSVEPAWDSLSLTLPDLCSLSFRTNKLKQIKNCFTKLFFERQG